MPTQTSRTLLLNLDHHTCNPALLGSRPRYGRHCGAKGAESRWGGHGASPRHGTAPPPRDTARTVGTDGPDPHGCRTRPGPAAPPPACAEVTAARAHPAQPEPAARKHRILVKQNRFSSGSATGCRGTRAALSGALFPERTRPDGARQLRCPPRAAPDPPPRSPAPHAPRPPGSRPSPAPQPAGGPAPRSGTVCKAPPAPLRRAPSANGARAARVPERRDGDAMPAAAAARPAGPESPLSPARRGRDAALQHEGFKHVGTLHACRPRPQPCPLTLSAASAHPRGVVSCCARRAAGQRAVL